LKRSEFIPELLAAGVFCIATVPGTIFIAIQLQGKNSQSLAFAEAFSEYRSE